MLVADRMEQTRLPTSVSFCAAAAAAAANISFLLHHTSTYWPAVLRFIGRRRHICSGRQQPGVRNSRCRAAARLSPRAVAGGIRADGGGREDARRGRNDRPEPRAALSVLPPTN